MGKYSFWYRKMAIYRGVKENYRARAFSFKRRVEIYWLQVQSTVISQYCAWGLLNSPSQNWLETKLVLLLPNFVCSNHGSNGSDTSWLDHADRCRRKNWLSNHSPTDYGYLCRVFADQSTSFWLFVANTPSADLLCSDHYSFMHWASK